ncbi:uncharacterized protein [Osmerus mordax]|uniref:uncharacterized protein n=1 Tax=Osmerus mordax TaxID=8014 RepID=UPI00350F3B0A
MESNPKFVKTLKGGLVLRATPAALGAPKPPPGARAKAAQEVEAEARAHVVSQSVWEVLGSDVQLDAAHRCLFPAVLTYKLSCDLRVVTMLRERAFGEQRHSALHQAVREPQRSLDAARDAVPRRVRALPGLGHRQFPPPPAMPPVPTPVWLLTVYSMDVLSRLDEVKARVTSVFGSILKMDSTKKVTKKLAGNAANTAAWVTNVGNEHGQVLVSVLTSVESVDLLLPMAAGLQERYRLAGVPPPQLIYVDRDCCSSFGGSKTAALFANWDRLVVRLDIWHLMWPSGAGRCHLPPPPPSFVSSRQWYGRLSLEEEEGGGVHRHCPGRERSRLGAGGMGTGAGHRCWVAWRARSCGVRKAKGCRCPSC